MNRCPTCGTLLLVYSCAKCWPHVRVQKQREKLVASWEELLANLDELTKESTGTRLKPCSLSSGLVHFVVVRGDLPPGLQVAQAVHAAGESSDRVPPGTVAVALKAYGEEHLLELAAELSSAGVVYTLIREDAGAFKDQVMAIGVEPTASRARVRKIFGSLPLAG